MEIPKVDIRSRKLIKAFIPTPTTLNHHKMGFKDEVVAAINVRLILFYSAMVGGVDTTINFITQLENSLAQCLSRFYPIAGRYNHQIRAIEYNNEGAEFVQARIQNNVKLQDMLDPKLNPGILNNLLPCGTCDAGEIIDPLLVIQATVFDCGGLTLGVSISHKVADAATLCTFLNDWAALTRGEITLESISPKFCSSEFLPPRGFLDFDPPLPRSLKHKFENEYITKRVLFSEKEISMMKEKVNGGQSYSRVQVVSAMIWKALIDVDRAKHGHPRASMLFQPVNIRGKTTPSIPNDSCGNLGGFIITECPIAQTLSMGFECLAGLLHDSIKKTIDQLGKLSSKSEELQTLVFDSFVKSETRDELVSVFPLTSWCKFPFYEVDFGLGPPVWAASSAGPVSMVTLMDGQGGFGVDAYVNLQTDDMHCFEKVFDMSEFVVE
uniref:pelargonidin 3-O-(6-caffeoylglucoside) 5-O-(6-O-malonylglucoside) 4'''-malonyltransferase-like n=1 Tax=Erigeron canadensis TaxID=72917 RepID=UPI001CB89BAB|nr:pelargonidin 3-O-(6-caffeoylglucoside) 5-O-(6-O-malonylglucoside) 4'''-malonyltransferase-like [Erigeron canadensis]